jgi:YNFM family putative membrane transporter
MPDAGRSVLDTSAPGWGSVACLYGSVVAAFVAMYLPQPILPVLAREFDVSASAASLAVSALILGLAAASLVWGPVSDRWGRKPVIVGCAFALVVPSLFCALAPTLWSLALFRFWQGVLLPGLTAVSVVYIAEEFEPEQVSTLLGGYIAATVSGGLLSRVLAGAVTEAADWRYAFAFSALLFLLVGLLLARLPASRRFVASTRLREAFREMARHLANMRLLGGFAVGFGLFFAFLAVFTYLPFYLERPPFAFSPLQIGLMYATYAAGVVSSPLAGMLAGRLGRPWVMRLGLAVAVVANLLTLVPETAWLVVALLMLCFGNFSAQGVATSYVATQAARGRGSATSLYLFAYYLGGSLGAYLPGLFWPHYGWHAVLALSLLALTGALAAATWLCREPRL